jgi:ribonuclease-3
MLFRRFPEHNEGQKSKMKASLVSTATLARLAERLQIGEHLLLGRGEEKTGGRRKQALIANSFEAVIAAIYLDGGIEQARAFIASQFTGVIEMVREPGGLECDYKSQLQEYLQAHDRPLPEYVVVSETGPDHRKLFDVEARVEGVLLAAASGSSKKEAEQEAARRAIERLTAGASA